MSRTGALVVAVGRVDKRPYWEAKWRNASGEQVKRRLGPAFLIGREWDPNYRQAGHGEKWRARWNEPLTRAGRPKAAPPGLLNRIDAEMKMTDVISQYETTHAVEREEAARQARLKETAHATLGEAGAAWLAYAERVQGLRPSTLGDYRACLQQIAREPEFRVMPRSFEWNPDASAIQRRAVAAQWPPKPVEAINASDVRRWRDRRLDDGGAARTANKLRQLLSNILGFAAASDDFPMLERNCVLDVEKVKEQRPGRIDYYEPNEVELLAATLHGGSHRNTARIPTGKRAKGRITSPRTHTAAEVAAMRTRDQQDGILVIVLAFGGLRLGEAQALRWKDVNFATQKLEIWRSYSGGHEGPTKSGRERFVPMAPQVAEALARLSQRDHFTGREDLVFAGEVGSFLDASAFRRRYKLACGVAGLRPLRVHDLRHGFLSQAAKVFSPQDVQRLAGHADPRTTARYLHSKAAPDEAERLGRLFSTGTAAEISAGRAAPSSS